MLNPAVSAAGIADMLSNNMPVDVLLVHGMCTHGRNWVVAANNGLRKSLGIAEELNEDNLPPAEKITEEYRATWRYIQLNRHLLRKAYAHMRLLVAGSSSLEEAPLLRRPSKL